MPERLLIRLHTDAHLTWVALDAAGKPLSTTNTGAPPAETIARTRQIVAVIPAESVLLLETPVVSQQRAQLARAIAFALEDQLASAVEEVHFALPDKVSGERTAVAAVAKTDLRKWLSELSSHGVRPDEIVPESLLLPLHDNGGTLMIDGVRAILRSGFAVGNACPIEGLGEWLHVNAIDSVEVFDFRPAAALQLPVAVTRYHERQRDPLALFAAQVGTAPRINLLQGEFAPSHRAIPIERLWRYAAAIAAVALILGFVYAGCDWWRLRNASARLDVAERAALHSAFPESDRVDGDPRQVMDSAIARLRGGSEAGGLLDILSRIGSVLGSTTRVAVKSIEYHNATLELALRAPDVATLDLIRERIANLGGLRAEITSSTSGNDGVEGRLRIVGGKP
jgi:general secretion pathway protein L